MKKVLILLLVVGVLIGTFAIAEAFSEGISLDQGDFSKGEEPANPDPSPCGGGSGEGPGGVPG